MSSRGSVAKCCAPVGARVQILRSHKQQLPHGEMGQSLKGLGQATLTYATGTMTNTPGCPLTSPYIHHSLRKGGASRHFTSRHFTSHLKHQQISQKAGQKMRRKIKKKEAGVWNENRQDWLVRSWELIVRRVRETAGRWRPARGCRFKAGS